MALYRVVYDIGRTTYNPILFYTLIKLKIFKLNFGWFDVSYMHVQLILENGFAGIATSHTIIQDIAIKS